MNEVFNRDVAIDNRFLSLDSIFKINGEKIISFISLYSFFMAVAFKLTLVQWLITQSNYSVIKVFGRNVLFVIIVFSIPYLFRKRWILLAFWILQFLFLGANLGYYIYSGQILKISQIIFSYKEWIGAMGSSVVIFRKVTFYLLFVDLPFLIISFLMFNKIRKTLSPFLLGNIILPIIPFCLYLNKMEFNNKSEVAIYNESFITFKHGILETQLLLQNVSEEDAISSIKYGSNIKIIPEESLNNLLFIQVESLNSDVIGLSYRDEEITPFLNSLVDNSVYYPYCISQHKAGNSSDAEFSIINGVEALNSFPASRLRTYNYENSLLKVLKNYRPLALHGNKSTNFDRNITYPNMGFEKMVGSESMGVKEVGWGIPDEDFFSFTFEQLKESSNPFIFYLITMSTHGPFNFVQNYFTNSTLESLDKENERNYLTSVNYLDKVLGEFINKVQNEFPQTVIVIYGDHTVDPAGDFYKPDTRFTYKGKNYEYVPLFIITPDNDIYRENSNVVSFLDISPTLLYLSGNGGDIRTFGQILPPWSSGYDTGILYNETFISREELWVEINR